MAIEQTVKSTQEQATAAWIQHLNQLRLDELLRKLAEQDLNLEAALKILHNAKSTIMKEIVGRNRGGNKGMHGFIAEVLEVAFGNADDVIQGEQPNILWINDNGPVDFLRGKVMVQQKFVQSDKHWGLTHILDHLKKYPDFIKNGGKYQIPRDFYEKIRMLALLPSEEAQLLTKGGEGPSYSDWEWVQKFLRESGVKLDDIEPSQLKYKDVQCGAVNNTLDSKEATIRNVDKERRVDAVEASKPTLEQGVEVTIQAAVLESAVEFCLGVYRKLKTGKKLHDFTAEDWKELGVDTVGAAVKGGVRGSTVYLLTNYANTPGCVATAFVTALFGIAAQAKLLREGKISKYEFVDNISVIALDVSVSAVSSFVGGKLIPVEVLGPIVGNTVGMFLYGIAKDYLSEKEQKLVAGFVEEIERLNEMLEARYRELINEIKVEFEKFSSIVELAFSDEANEAFNNSIVLADYVGVEENALRDIGAVNDYFLS